MLIFFALLLTSAFCYDWRPVDTLITEAINSRVFPGAVLLITNASSTLYQNAYGTLTYRQDLYEQRTLNDTLFDLASITKCMGTTAAIMHLYESKLLHLNDTIAKYIPEYDSNGKRTTTIGNLLLHNGGLPYDYDGVLPETKQELLEKIFYSKLTYPIGSKFVYSNLGYIVLGEVIKKVTNRTLGDYFQQNRVFMGLKETMFSPNQSLYFRTAPCEYDVQIRQRIVRGQPHERLAYLLEEAGHSGYFSVATDVSRFIKLMLCQGKIGVQARAFQASTIQTFTTRVPSLPYENDRGYGFQTKCEGTKMKKCFGHQGSTGTMMWADTQNNITITLLSNRVHPQFKNDQFWSWRGELLDAVLTVLGF